MKKFTQIALVLVLIAVLFQFVAPAPVAAGTISSSAAISNDFRSSATVEDSQMAACLIRIKGIHCVMPNVGWNT
jgi:hypothetical protein